MGSTVSKQAAKIAEPAALYVAVAAAVEINCLQPAPKWWVNLLPPLLLRQVPGTGQRPAGVCGLQGSLLLCRLIGGVDGTTLAITNFSQILNAFQMR